MASEIQWNWITAKSGYALLRSSSGTIFNRTAGAFEAYTAANYLTYQLSGREQSSGGTYTADFPAAITTPGIYRVEARNQAAGSGLQSDDCLFLGSIFWNGSAVIPAVDLRSGGISVSGVFVQSGLATAALVNSFLPVQLPKGRSFNNFPFPLYASGTNLPFTSGSISGQVSQDGGAFGLLQSGSFAEIGGGWYNCQYLTSGDLNANSVALRFSASGADLRDVTIILQK